MSSVSSMSARGASVVPIDLGDRRYDILIG